MGTYNEGSGDEAFVSAGFMDALDRRLEEGLRSDPVAGSEKENLTMVQEADTSFSLRRYL